MSCVIYSYSQINYASNFRFSCHSNLWIRFNFISITVFFFSSFPFNFCRFIRRHIHTYKWNGNDFVVVCYLLEMTWHSTFVWFLFFIFFICEKNAKSFFSALIFFSSFACHWNEITTEYRQARNHVLFVKS